MRTWRGSCSVVGMHAARQKLFALVISLSCVAGCGKSDSAGSAAPAPTAPDTPAKATPTSAAPSAPGESRAACEARCDKEKVARDRLKCKMSCPSG